MTGRNRPAPRLVAEPPPITAGWEPDQAHRTRIAAAGHSAAIALAGFRRRPSVCPTCALRRPPPGWHQAPGHCAGRCGT